MSMVETGETVALKWSDGYRFVDPNRSAMDIINAEPTDILCGTRESIYWNLVDRHPTSDPAYSHVFLTPWQVMVFDEPVALDYQMAVDHLLRIGKGGCRALMLQCAKPPRNIDVSWTSSNIEHPHGLEGLWYVVKLSYDKKKALRENKLDLEKMVSRNDLWWAIRELTKEIPFSVSISSYSIATESSDVADQFMAGIELFNTLFGKNAHRTLPRFQELKESWKRNNARNNTKWLKLDTPAANKFVRWMQLEMEVKKPRKRQLRLRAAGTFKDVEVAV